MAELDDFDPTDDNNTERWPENMQFSAVNDAGRADEGILARWWRDNNGSLAASGSSNAFTVTSNRTIAQLYDDLTLCFTANHTITGACTLNLNGIGAKAIKSPNGANLGSGAIVEGQPVHVVYKSGPDAWLMVSAPAHMLGYATTSVAGVVELATGAEVQTASDTTRPVTPGLQRLHPAHPKAWATITLSGGTPILTADYGVASVSDLGIGRYRVTLDEAMADTNYAVIGTTAATSNNSMAGVGVQKISETVFVIWLGDMAGNDPGDPIDVSVSFAVFGDLA